jgi:hypothetical protein
MSKELFIYENAVPLNKNTHQEWSLAKRGDFHFASELNVIPIALIEFSEVAKHFPILFAKGKDGHYFPAAITGLGNKNLFVNEEGESDMGYIPLFVRQYPFVFARGEDPEKFSLYIDESHEGWNQEGRGDRLFDTEGEATDFLNNRIRFMQQAQVEFMKTQLFCKQLLDEKLLKAIKVAVPRKKGTDKEILSGFFAFNKEALKNISDEVWLRIAKNDSLELLYLHLFSLESISKLVSRFKETFEE